MTGHRTKVSGIRIKEGKLVRVKTYRAGAKAKKAAREAAAWAKAGRKT